MNEVFMMIESQEEPELQNWISLDFDLDDPEERSLAQKLLVKALDQEYSVKIAKKR